MFRWAVTFVVGVTCSRWHKSLSFRCCLWDKLMCNGCNIGKEWIVWFGICGQHILHLSIIFTVAIDRAVMWCHGEHKACQRLEKDRNRPSATRIDMNVVRVEDLICRGWSEALEAANSTVVREWKFLIVNGCKFQCWMPAATGLQMSGQDGTNESMWLGITLKNSDTSLNWMN